MRVISKLFLAGSVLGLMGCSIKEPLTVSLYRTLSATYPAESITYAGSNKDNILLQVSGKKWQKWAKIDIRTERFEPIDASKRLFAQEIYEDVPPAGYNTAYSPIPVFSSVEDLTPATDTSPRSETNHFFQIYCDIENKNFYLLMPKTGDGTLVRIASLELPTNTIDQHGFLPIIVLATPITLVADIFIWPYLLFFGTRC